MRRALRVLAVLALAAVAGAALAQSKAEALVLVYAGPASCPSEAEFVRRLRARLGTSQATDGAHRTLDVRIAQEGGQYQGRLSLVEHGGRSTTKALSGHECEELVDALALVAALALRSEAVAATGDEGHPPPPPAMPRAPPPAQSRLSESRATAESRLGVAAGGLLTAGATPAVILGGSLSVDWALMAAGPLSPAVALELAAGTAPDVTRPGGTASFWLLVARVDVCVVRLVVGPRLEIRGCLLGDAGTMHARGSETVNPASSSRGWFALGASSQLEVPVTRRFAIRLVAGAEAPLRRDRYAFGAADFFAVPPVIATGSLMVAGYFWP